MYTLQIVSSAPSQQFEAAMTINPLPSSSILRRSDPCSGPLVHALWLGQFSSLPELLQSDEDGPQGARLRIEFRYRHLLDPRPFFTSQSRRFSDPSCPAIVASPNPLRKLAPNAAYPSSQSVPHPTEPVTSPSQHPAFHNAI